MERAIKILNREVQKRESMLMQKEHFLRVNEIKFELKSLNKVLNLVNKYTESEQLNIGVVVGALFCEDCQKWVKKKCTCGNTELSLDYTE